MEFVDSHCHLHFDRYAADREQVFDGAVQAGVTRIVNVGCSLDDSERAIAFAADHKNVWATAGAHPHDSAAFLKQPGAPERLKNLLTRPKIVAVGEIGLDYYHQHTSLPEQETAFRRQIEIGLPGGLPFVFHVRDAWKDFWRIFDSYQTLRGVVHSFSSTVKDLDEALGRGLYVGLNGIMTFTRDQGQLQVAKAVPLDKLLLETDAPFLTPKPFRGERCEPRHVVLVGEFLAQLRQESLSQLAAATTTNAVSLFNLDRAGDD
jgi:TatD DNase family protein